MSKINESKITPFAHVPAKKRSEMSSTMVQALPMAAMFMKNKMISWASLFLAVQSYLNQPIHSTPTAEDDNAQPPMLRLVFAFVGIIVCYMDFFFPNLNPLARANSAASTLASTATAAVTGK